MPIANVALSNTFNEFRSTTNLVIGEVNKLSDGTAVLVVDAITANTYTGTSSTLTISGNTGTDNVSLTTETLRTVGTNGISTSVASNTITVTLDNSGVTAGTYGSGSKVPQIVIDAQGRITSAANVNVAGVSGFNYHTGNANFQIVTADGGSFTASIGQDLGTSASVSFQDLTVTGNVTFTGNVVSVTANNLVVEDNIIQIGKFNNTDAVDLGFLGHYYSGANLHAGLFRDATDGVWKFFDNYTVEPATNTNINISGSGFRFADLTANNITSNGIFSGNGSQLTTLNASNLTSGTVATARLASGTANNLTYLRGDQTWATIPATTGTSANGASTIVARDTGGSFDANRVTATTFIGSGAEVTTLNASNLTSGTVATARLGSGTANSLTYLRGDQTYAVIPTASANGASTIVARDTGGSFAANRVTATTFIGSGASLTSIPNSATTASSSNGASTIVARDTGGSFAANRVTATTFIGSGAEVTTLNASNLTSGTVATARLGSGTANSLTYLRGDQTYAVIPTASANGAGTIVSRDSGGSAAFNIVTANVNLSGVSDSNTAASHYLIETGSDGYIRPKTLSNVQIEIVTTAALATGTANNVTYLRGDRTWATLGASGATITDDTSTNSNARYLVFTTATSGTMTIANTSSTKLYFNPSTGTLNATVFNSLSDETLKKNITKITNATDLISLLDGVEFEWAENGTKSSGLIAQWIEKIVPHLVSSGDSEIKTVNYSGLIAYLVEAVKELNERVKKLESK